MDAGLVSCLCVTRLRAARLRRAIGCFQRQTYTPRELLVVYETDDAETAALLASIADPAIRGHAVPALPKQSLGALRNIAVAHARGEYIAQWDDDDWYAPTRLTVQLGAMRQMALPVCVLKRWIMFDELTGTAYVSAARGWEGSVVARRGVLGRYADLPRGEEAEAFSVLAGHDSLVLVDRPDLYIYTVHAHNTWDRSHWLTNLLPYATALAAPDQARVRALLEQTLETP